MRIIALIVALLCVGASIVRAEPHSGSPCIKIYYDHTQDAGYRLGKVYAVFIQNLLGHFPKYQQIVEPIESYVQGGLDECKANFYIGSYFENDVPKAFMEDFTTTTHTVVWMGYTIWKLGNDVLDRVFGYTYERLTTLDEARRDEDNNPTYYKFIHYKGERFYKYGGYSQARQMFLAPFEMSLMRKTRELSEVLAEAQHNGTGDRLPYIIRNQNKFYITDIPLSYMHEEDRYLVFADLLFDILDEEPLYKDKRPAIFRIEDVSVRTSYPNLWRLIRVLHRYNIPFQTAIIPIFTDPLNRTERGDHDITRMVHRDRIFLDYLSILKDFGTSFIWHGTTHQYRNRENPHHGSSGEDYEFWLLPENTPVPDDSVQYVLDRLNDGWQSLSSADIPAHIWEVPHYQASPLDYMIFSYVFSWTIGRVMYVPFRAENLPERNASLWYESNALSNQDRFTLLKDIQVTPEYAIIDGQIIPYEIYGDVYGQRVLPESLGNPQPYMNPYVTQTTSIEKILRTARRNIKLRDVWGSFFFHPLLMGPTFRGGLDVGSGDPPQLIELIEEFQRLGYEFINLQEFIRDKKDILRPPPIFKRLGENP